MRVFGDSAVRRHTSVADVQELARRHDDPGVRRAVPQKLAVTEAAIAAAKGVLEPASQPRRGLLPRRPGRDQRHRCLRGRRGRAHRRHRAGPGQDLVRDRALPRPARRVLVAERAASRAASRSRRSSTDPRSRSGFLTARGPAGQRLRSEVRVSRTSSTGSSTSTGSSASTNLLLTAYDADGTPIRGIADPTWSGTTPHFPPDRVERGVAAGPAAGPPAAAAPRPVPLPLRQQRPAVPPPPRRGRGHPRPAARAGAAPEAPRHRARPPDAACAPPAHMRHYEPSSTASRSSTASGPPGLPSTATADAGPRPSSSRRTSWCSSSCCATPTPRSRTSAICSRSIRRRAHLLLGAVRRLADRRLRRDRRPGSRGRLPGWWSRRDRVPRPPQPFPGPPAGPLRRELRRVRACCSPISRGSAGPART